MPYDGTVTAQQAEQARRTKLSVGQKRKVPDMLGMIANLKASKQYHIFNVGPWKHVVPTGSTGTFYIPACPTEKECLDRGIARVEYVEMTQTVPAIMDELIIKSEAEYDRLMDDGRQFALEIIGEGRGRNPAYSLKHSGVFLAEGEVPTKEELAQANLLLRAQCSEIVSYIRSVYSSDRKFFSQIINAAGAMYYAAAHVLNLQNETWMVDSAPSGQIRCKLCGAMSDTDVAMCPNGHIINPDLYAEYMAEQEQLVEQAAERVQKPKPAAKAAKAK